MVYLSSNLVASLYTKSFQSSWVIVQPSRVTEDTSSNLFGSKDGVAIAGIKSFRNAMQYELSS